MLMNYFRRLDRNKIQFDFVVHQQPAGDYAEQIRELGGNIFYVPRFHGYNIKACIHAWEKIFDENQQDVIIHGHMPSSAPLYLWLARKAQRYTIAHSHTSGKQKENGYVTYLLKKLSYQLTTRVADKYYACSEQAGLMAYGRGIVQSERFAVWYNAIDFERFSYRESVRRDIKENLGIPQDAFVLGHVGRLTWAKNHAFLLEVFAEVHRRHPEARLLLVGDGELREEIKAQVQQLGLDDSVYFAGSVDDPERYLCAMDVFVFPSHYEGLSTVNIEAQVSGLPCIVSTGVPREVSIADAKPVEFLPLGDVGSWADAVEKWMDKPREPGHVTNHDYDIRYAVKWAEGEYTRMAKQLAAKKK